MSQTSGGSPAWVLCLSDVLGRDVFLEASAGSVGRLTIVTRAVSLFQGGCVSYSETDKCLFGFI